jgi:hypothetical protein
MAIAFAASASESPIAQGGGIAMERTRP